MALDKNAGQKRTVSALRNFGAMEEVTSSSLAAETVKPVIAAPKALEVPAFTRKAEEPTKTSFTPKVEAAPAKTRHRKVSFFTSQETEERFKKARLRAGFEKLEDAYNRALEHFILAVEKGEIDEF